MHLKFELICNRRFEDITKRLDALGTVSSEADASECADRCQSIRDLVQRYEKRAVDLLRQEPDEARASLLRDDLAQWGRSLSQADERLEQLRPVPVLPEHVRPMNRVADAEYELHVYHGKHSGMLADLKCKSTLLRVKEQERCEKLAVFTDIDSSEDSRLRAARRAAFDAAGASRRLRKAIKRLHTRLDELERMEKPLDVKLREAIQAFSALAVSQ